MKLIQICAFVLVIFELNAFGEDEIRRISDMERSNIIAKIESSPAPERTGVAWSPFTNGIRCGVEFTRHYEGVDLHVWIQVPLTNCAYPTASGLKKCEAIFPRTNFTQQFNVQSYNEPWGREWLGSPNNYYGKMELRGEDGCLIPILDLKLNNDDYYPEFMRWSNIRPHLPGMGFLRPDAPHCFQWQELRKFKDCRQMDSFFELMNPTLKRFESLFQLKKAGRYQVTLYPVIYRRSTNPEDDQDVYQRIEIPPITTEVFLTP